jgi:hypothetical protein
MPKGESQFSKPDFIEYPLPTSRRELIPFIEQQYLKYMKHSTRKCHPTPNCVFLPATLVDLCTKDNRAKLRKLFGLQVVLYAGNRVVVSYSRNLPEED